MIKTKRKKINILGIVNARLNLQSTQLLLDEQFGINLPSVRYLNTEKFKNLYNNWDEDKKDKFLNVIGGTYRAEAENLVVSMFES